MNIQLARPAFRAPGMLWFAVPTVLSVAALVVTVLSGGPVAALTAPTLPAASVAALTAAGTPIQVYLSSDPSLPSASAVFPNAAASSLEPIESF